MFGTSSVAGAAALTAEDEANCRKRFRGAGRKLDETTDSDDGLSNRTGRRKEAIVGVGGIADVLAPQGPRHSKYWDDCQMLLC